MIVYVCSAIVVVASLISAWFSISTIRIVRETRRINADTARKYAELATRVRR